MTHHPTPHPAALARHTQSCRNDSPSFAELHALAGKYDRCPVPDLPPRACPVCGAAVGPAATYCGDGCRMAAQKRLNGAGFRKGDDDGFAPYNW